MVLKWIAGFAVSGAIVFGLSACATLDEDQCNAVDWRVLGQSDGAQGRDQTFVARHQEACSRFGIGVDTIAWQSGWNEGIRTYCTFENGVRVGQSTTANPAVCPADLIGEFRLGYDAASGVRIAQNAVDRAETRIDIAIQDLAAATTEEERLQAQIEISDARSDQAIAQRDLTRAQQQLQQVLLQRQTALTE